RRRLCHHVRLLSIGRIGGTRRRLARLLPLLLRIRLRVVRLTVVLAVLDMLLRRGRLVLGLLILVLVRIGLVWAVARRSVVLATGVARRLVARVVARHRLGQHRVMGGLWRVERLLLVGTAKRVEGQVVGRLAQQVVGAQVLVSRRDVRL